MSDCRQEQNSGGGDGDGGFEDRDKQAIAALRRSKKCVVVVGPKLVQELGLEDVMSDPVVRAAIKSGDALQDKESASKVLAALSKHCGLLAKMPESRLIPLLEHLLSQKKLVRVYVDNAYMSLLIPRQSTASISTATAAAASSDQMAARLESLMVTVGGCIDKFFCARCGAKSRLTQAVLFKAMCGQNVKCEACGDSRELASGGWSNDGDGDGGEKPHGLVPDVFRARNNMQAATDQARMDASSAVDFLLAIGEEAQTEESGSDLGSTPMVSAFSILRSSAKQVVSVDSDIDLFVQRWSEEEATSARSTAVQRKQKANADPSVFSLSAEMADASLGDDASAIDSSGSLDAGDATAAERQAKLHAKGGKGRNRERTNLNHLLNFTMPARMPSPLPIVRPRRRAADHGAGGERQAQLNKTTFINANFRFVLKPRFWSTFMAITNRPDMQLRWEWIERVIMPVASEVVTCPICLSPPVAARIPKCGHVFCYPCILRYLSYAEKGDYGTRKCPVCWGAIAHEDLLPVHLWTVQYRAAPDSSAGTQAPLQDSGKLSTGAHITMRLMKRLRGTTICLPRSSDAHIYTPEILEAQRLASKEGAAAKREGVFDSRSFPWTFTEGALAFAKFMLAGHDYCKDEYERELSELACELVEEVGDSMAQMFIEYATKSIEDALGAANSAFASDSRLEKRARNEQANMVPMSQSASDDTDTASTGVSACRDEQYKNDFLYFYQADDGQHIYMHPLYMRVLAHEYDDYVALPDSLQIKLRHVVESTIDDEVRHRFRFLDHLSLRCDVVFVEPELKGLVSRRSIDKFKQQISQRDKQHAARARHAAMDEARSAMMAAAASSSLAGSSSAGYSSHLYASSDAAIGHGSTGARPPDASSFPALASESASETPDIDPATPALASASSAVDSGSQRSVWPREPLPQQSAGSHAALVDEYVWEEFERAVASRIDDHEASFYDDRDDIDDPDDFSIEAKGSHTPTGQSGHRELKSSRKKKGLKLVLTGSSARRRK